MRKKSSTAAAPRKLKVLPSSEHWWWRPGRLKRALDANPPLDRFFYWKVKGRKSPDGTKWTPAQRRSIETVLWLYELDARISKKFLFGQPAHLLAPEHVSSVVEFARPMNALAPAAKAGKSRQHFSWTWIEYFDQRNAPHAPKLTRAELDGVIAAMKFCLEYFLRG